MFEIKALFIQTLFTAVYLINDKVSKIKMYAVKMVITAIF